MAKGIMYINGQRVAFDGEKNVLAVIRKAGINMPTLCYYSDLSVYGACRMCVVEDDRGRIDASCSMEPRDGLSIQTNTARLLKYRRMIIELLLASHDRDCTVCEKSSACELRRLALRFGVRRVRFEDTREQLPLDTSSPSVVRDPNKCILCGDCVRTCEEIQGMNIIDFTHRSADLRVMPAFDQKLAETDCIGCGQCAAVCPTAAITVYNDIGRVWRALHDKNKRVVFQIAPAVRVAIGEAFGLHPGENAMGKMVAALRLMGAAEVFDTSFAADLTTVVEAKEFMDRLKNGGTFPMFTSCCPAWSVMAKKLFPQFKDYISMALTPMVITARMVKKDHPDARICFIGPCSAKKLEANRRSVRSDVDFVLTFEELQGMFDAKDIDFTKIEGDPADDMVEGTAMGRGFAVGGGVAAAVVEAIKHIDPDREVLIEYGDGLKECRKMLMMAKAGKRDGYLLEGMGCPGGCVAGAGTVTPVKESAVNVEKFKQQAAAASSTESPYLNRLKEVEE